MSDDLLFGAVEYATRAHHGQFRKGTRIPYVLHPLRVAQILIEVDASPLIVVAGILHDTVEDTPTRLQDLEARFGAEVATLVASVSEPDRSAAWEIRKQHTIRALQSATEATLLIACADKLDNVRSMGRGCRRQGEGFWDRFHRPREGQAWYYQSVAAAIRGRAGAEPLLGLAETLHDEVQRVFGTAASG